MSYKTRAHDQRVADDVNVDRSLMCPAHGCPLRWSVQGEAGRACSWHYAAPTHDWPRITQQLVDAEVAKAMRNASTPTSGEPLTREARFAILCKLREVGRLPRENGHAWALALRARHEAGERLTSGQIACYRAVLDAASRRAAANQSAGFDLPPVAPAMPPAVELPPVDAYTEEQHP